MQAQIKFGRVLGVEIGLHYSWLIIALLITLSLAEHFHGTNPDWGREVIWTTSVLTALLFFASIVAHELAHAAVAQASGLPVRSITLFALGGVAQIEREPTGPKTEFKMAIVGPITSIGIGLMCLAIASGLGWTPNQMSTSPFLAMLVWLGYINILLGVFNMIPGFPLDGGRVLRALIWWAIGDAGRATRIAARAGQLVALSFIALGIFRFYAGAGFGGLWIAFIGWFLLDAARASYAEAEIVARLRGLKVGDVMTQDCQIVDGRFSLQNLVEDYLLRTARRCFFVVENGALAGLITPNEVKEVERSRWPYTTVRDAMKPLEKLHTVTPLTPVSEALETMGRDDVHQLPVVSNGHLEGIITRAHVINLLQNRAELSV